MAILINIKLLRSRSLFSLLLMTAVLLIACKSERDKIADQISELEQELRADSLAIINEGKARELIGMYSGFADTYRDDTLSAEYLFRAGEISSGIGDYFQAIQFYKQCSEKVYYSKRSVAFFLMGFIYENYLDDTGNAKRIYETFLQKFPGDKLEKDVRFSLEHLGKSPEELIKQFEQNLSDSTELAG